MQEIDFTSATFITTTACILLCLIQLYYFIFPYSRVLRHNKKQNQLPRNENCPPVSIIIVTKNSGMYLQENLPAIMEQNYPEFEVIVVNDELTGDDEDILKLLQNKYNHLYHTFIPKTARYVSRKKLGIAMGIKASRYEWIVVTEAVCKPDSENWLRSLSRYFTEGTDVVLGYCNYQSADGKESLFSRFIKSDLLLTSMRYLGYALGGQPYMGIGRNMAYRKEVYYDHNGFSSRLNLLRGEDDIFVNEIADNRNTKVAISDDSIMRMPVPKFKRTWSLEKLGYEVTGKYLKGMARFKNSLETWSAVMLNISFIVALAVCITNKEWIFAALNTCLYLLRFCIVMIVFRNTSKAMNEGLCCYFPIYDFLRPFYALSLKMKYVFRKKNDFMRR